MAEIPVYTFPTTHRVSFGNYNTPTASSDIKVPKGMGTELQFIVVNADGRQVVLNSGESLMFVVTNIKTKQRIFEYTLMPVTGTLSSESGLARPSINMASKIYYSCVIPAAAFSTYQSGRDYKWSILLSSSDSMQALYTNEVGAFSGNLELVETTLSVNRPSTTILPTHWNEVTCSDANPLAIGYDGLFKVYASDEISTLTQLGAGANLASYCTIFKMFTGRFQIQASLMNNSPSDADEDKWFTIPIADGVNYLEPNVIAGTTIPLDGIFAGNFQNNNYMWIRFLLLCPMKDAFSPTQPIDFIEKLSMRV